MPMEPNFLKALIGRYNLSDNYENGSKFASVQEIIMHPEWNYRDDKYDADIAIVKLCNSVEFSNQIQTVCLPAATLPKPVGRGVVVGWGKSSNEAENDDTPNQIEMPAVNASYCYTRFPKLADYSSYRAFCAGFENEQRGSCTGDSGGGFFMKDSLRFSWTINGIVSSSLINEEYDCDVNSFGIYTNVALFRSWIDQQTLTTGNTDWIIVNIQCQRKR